MSAFLGYIHYWLYHKINRVVEREQLLYDKAQEVCGVSAEELQAEVWQIYGMPVEGKLEDLIDHQNIHGWLQRQIIIAETREATFIKELINTCGESAYTLAIEAFAEHGKLCGEHAKVQGKYEIDSAGGIYKALNDYILNGMPCDQVDTVTINEPDKLVWEGDVCLQERNWAKAGVDKKRMKKLYQQWITQFVLALNPAFMYQQLADTLQGERLNQYQIVKQ